MHDYHDTEEGSIRDSMGDDIGDWDYDSVDGEDPNVTRPFKVEA